MERGNHTSMPSVVPLQARWRRIVGACGKWHLTSHSSRPPSRYAGWRRLNSGVEAVEKPLFADVISPYRAIFLRHVSIASGFSFDRVTDRDRGFVGRFAACGYDLA
jgi:hypothetical protein